MIYVRAIHFAATLAAAGVVFFIVCIGAPAFAGAPDSARLRAKLWPKLAFIFWFSLVLALGSGAVWLILTAASMSGEAPVDVLSEGVAWTVLSQTHFGWAWTARLVVALALAASFVPLLAERQSRASSGTLAITAAAAFTGALAWAGHAIGGQDTEAVVHPAADVLHLIAAAAWLGALPPLALLFGAAGKDEAALAVVRTATLRFSALGIAAVGTLLVSGAINTWYLAGSVEALTGTTYGKLLLAKIALFFVMVAVAAVNRQRLTPRLTQNANLGSAQNAVLQLRRNAVIETLAGLAIICIVAVLGTKAPASHAGHHPAYGALPADAAFVHIHTEHAMADVTIIPGRVGEAHATVRLWDGDFEPLTARGLKFSITAPAAGSTPSTQVAVQDADGAWQIGGIALTQPGNWTVSVDADLGANGHATLAAPIVIDPAR
jgi:copper resistance protein D